MQKSPFIAEIYPGRQAGIFGFRIWDTDLNAWVLHAMGFPGRDAAEEAAARDLAGLAGGGGQ
jgi:hypothetical protein